MRLDNVTLRNRVNEALKSLASCKLCPRECGVNRLKDERGFCKPGRKLVVSSYSPHFGEEPPLTGLHGSGTIFFTSCNMRCVFCQNYQISQGGIGDEVSEEELARMMLLLQRLGCHNINLVSPTHFVPQIIRGIELAKSQGLTLPFVYNTNGYDSLETLNILDGIIDIYLPDIKYADDKMAQKYSFAKDYVYHSRQAIKEMLRQVGNLEVDQKGIARRGLIVRHLVLPDNIAGTYECLAFLAQEVSKEVRISLMAQYNPLYKAEEFPEINRKITLKEYIRAKNWARELGLNNVWTQDITSPDIGVPDFESKDVFRFG